MEVIVTCEGLRDLSLTFLQDEYKETCANAHHENCLSTAESTEN